MKNNPLKNYRNKFSWGLLGAGASAVAASLCCVGPLVLLSLGATGEWIGNLTALAPYRPLFIIVSLTFLGFAFFRTYKKPAMISCNPGSPCKNPELTRRNKIILLWLMTILILGLLIFPYLVSYVFAQGQDKTAPTEQVVLEVKNMTCAACPVVVRKSLTVIDGVKEAHVTLNPPEAVVVYDPDKVAVEDLIKATAKAGYPSSVMQDKEP